MKKVVVVDTNIVFSILRSKQSKAEKIIFEEDDTTFYAPNFLSIEIFKHKERILRKGQLSEEEVYELLQLLFDKIQFFNEMFISTKNAIQAYEICKGVDEKDTPFVALCLQLDAPLWTRDEKLKKHLISKGFNRFFE
jgi:predicted nucleic acid-binding protein